MTPMCFLPQMSSQESDQPISVHPSFDFEEPQSLYLEEDESFKASRHRSGSKAWRMRLKTKSSMNLPCVCSSSGVLHSQGRTPMHLCFGGTTNNNNSFHHTHLQGQSLRSAEEPWAGKSLSFDTNPTHNTTRHPSLSIKHSMPLFSTKSIRGVLSTQTTPEPPDSPSPPNSVSAPSPPPSCPPTPSTQRSLLAKSEPVFDNDGDDNPAPPKEEDDTQCDSPLFFPAMIRRQSAHVTFSMVNMAPSTPQFIRNTHDNERPYSTSTPLSRRLFGTSILRRVKSVRLRKGSSP